MHGYSVYIPKTRMSTRDNNHHLDYLIAVYVHLNQTRRQCYLMNRLISSHTITEDHIVTWRRAPRWGNGLGILNIMFDIIRCCDHSRMSIYCICNPNTSRRRHAEQYRKAAATWTPAHKIQKLHHHRPSICLPFPPQNELPHHTTCSNNADGYQKSCS